MQAKLVKALPAGADWLYEIKWDGYRVEAITHGDTVKLLSRNAKNLTTSSISSTPFFALPKSRSSGHDLPESPLLKAREGRPTSELSKSRLPGPFICDRSGYMP